MAKRSKKKKRKSKSRKKKSFKRKKKKILRKKKKSIELKKYRKAASLEKTLKPKLPKLTNEQSECFEKILKSTTNEEKSRVLKLFKSDIMNHVLDVKNKYIIPPGIIRIYHKGMTYIQMNQDTYIDIDNRRSVSTIYRLII